MSEFFVTFGCQYASIPHPTFPVAHPDGWVAIVAEDEFQARVMAVDVLGSAWSSLYDTQPDRSLFPRGELCRVARERGELLMTLPDRTDPAFDAIPG